MVAPVKACNFTNIRLRHGCIFVKFRKRWGCILIRCLNFLKVHQNTGEKIFAKYLSTDDCFVKTNTISCDDNDNAMFPNTRAFAFTRQPRNFTWSTRAIYLRSSSVFLCRLKFWFANKLKMNLRIAPTDTSFCKYQHYAKICIVFKRWCNCLILWKIIFQLESLKD